MARVRTKEYVYAAAAVGWNSKISRLVFDEDVMLIGCAYSGCPSATTASEVRVSKGVSDPAVDVEADDVYFSVLGMTEPGGTGGASQGFDMLPEGYFFPIHEDEPIFIDLFAAAIGDGGHCLLYYVLKREWNKKTF